MSIPDFSKLFSVDTRDAIKGLVVTVFGVIIAGLLQILQTGGALPTPAQWETVGITGLIAGLAYISKNYITNSKDQLLTPDPKKGGK